MTLARRRPPRLRRGDRVAVVSPSGPVDAGRLERGVALLQAWDLDVVVGPHARDDCGYLAGHDSARAADLTAAWLDPSVRAVLCARGGYGAARLLEHLDWAALRAQPPKVLLGSSDVTVLHEVFGRRLDLVTLFGPMPATAVLAGASAGDNGDEPSIRHLRGTLFGPGGPGAPPLALPADEPVELVPGSAEGVLAGGTLTLLAAALGTPYAGAGRDAIVLLEDVGESPYRLDRLLTQLLQAGWFDGVRGVVLGSWTGCGAGALDVVHERLAPLAVPVLAGLPVGHGPRQLTVPLGTPALLDTRVGAVSLLEPALA